jgi:hypothetical protein
MTAAMSAGTKEKFPFTSELRTGEVAAVQHIRDYSNYLFPRGVLNLFGNIVVYLRGILAKVVLLLPWLTFAAALTRLLESGCESAEAKRESCTSTYFGELVRRDSEPAAAFCDPVSIKLKGEEVCRVDLHR